MPEPTAAESDLYFEADDAQDAAPAPAPKPTPQPAPQPAAPQHDPRTLRLAAQFGVSGDDYSPKELDRIVDALVERTHRREEAIFHALNSRPVAPAPQPAAPAPEPEPADPLDYDESQFDELTNKVLRAQRDEIKALRKKYATTEEREARRESESLFGAFDAAFEAIGDPRYGAGDAATLDPDGPEMRLRKRLIAAAGLAKGMPLRQVTRAIVQTHRDFYGADAPKPQPKSQPADPKTDAGAYGDVAATNGHQPPPAPAPAKPVRPRDPETGLFLSDADIAAREEAVERDRYFSGLTERPTSRKAPALKGRAAEIEALKEYRAKMVDAGAPDEDFDENGQFIP